MVSRRKKVSSTPFTLFVTAADQNRPDEPPSRVRIGAELPVCCCAAVGTETGNRHTWASAQAFGTNIDLSRKPSLPDDSKSP
jgi:hypothetical protein